MRGSVWYVEWQEGIVGMDVGCVEFQDAFLRTVAAEGCVDPRLYLQETV